MADSEQTREEKEQTQRIYTTIKNYQDVFSSHAGKKVLIDLLRRHFMFQTTVAKNADGSIDVEGTFVNEGMRNTMLFILSKLEKSERDLQALLKEMQDE